MLRMCVNVHQHSIRRTNSSTHFHTVNFLCQRTHDSLMSMAFSLGGLIETANPAFPSLLALRVRTVLSNCPVAQA